MAHIPEHIPRQKPEFLYRAFHAGLHPNEDFLQPSSAIGYEPSVFKNIQHWRNSIGSRTKLGEYL
jgi:hypothetical protein